MYRYRENNEGEGITIPWQQWLAHGLAITHE